jgi:hypothetical protein
MAGGRAPVLAAAAVDQFSRPAKNRTNILKRVSSKVQSGDRSRGGKRSRRPVPTPKSELPQFQIGSFVRYSRQKMHSHVVVSQKIFVIFTDTKLPSFLTFAVNCV